jgi:hypothetical protein
MEKKLIPTPQELLEISYELSKLHLDRLREKSNTPEGLTPHEGNAVCTYLKTFSQITKNEKEVEEKASKSLAKMSDEEIKKELAKILNEGEDSV